MALLRRYGAYAAMAAVFLYLLYSLSFPYETNSVEPGKQPQRPQHGEGMPQAGEPQRPPLPNPQEPPPPKVYDWPKVPLVHPVTSMIPLPTAEAQPLPRIQHKFEEEEDATAKNIRESRREEVKKTFLKCWRNYRQKAWMHDELRPITGGSRDTFGGWAATLIDALDTLWIMGFKEEFTSAMKDVAQINFGTTNLEKVNVFETTIRHLGGLLSAYELSKEDILLQKAKEVGEMLYHAFDTPNHMPLLRWDMHKAGSGQKQMADSTVLLAEIGSLTLEFSRLSQITGDSKWYDAITRITLVFEGSQDETQLPGMWPILVNARKREFRGDSTSEFTLAAMADSMYEYLAKTYALLGGQVPAYKKMYEKAMKAAIEHTLFRPMTPENTDMLMSGFVSFDGDNAIGLDPEMQHLICFTGGMFALGGKIFDLPEHVTIGRKLTDTCVWAYKASPAGIMPEVSHLYKCPNMDECNWDEAAWQKEIDRKAAAAKNKDPQQNIANLRLPKGFTSIDDRRYILRPEAIESVFVLYRITGEQQWQAAAWDMFTAINQNTQTDLGNAALWDVSADSPPKMDSMESFWMGETLKYFYLIFSEPDLLSLDDYVFNTEAHPFKLPKPKLREEMKEQEQGKEQEQEKEQKQEKEG